MVPPGHRVENGEKCRRAAVSEWLMENNGWQFIVAVPTSGRSTDAGDRILMRAFHHFLQWGAPKNTVGGYRPARRRCFVWGRGAADLWEGGGGRCKWRIPTTVGRQGSVQPSGRRRKLRVPDLVATHMQMLEFDLQLQSGCKCGRRRATPPNTTRDRRRNWGGGEKCARSCDQVDIQSQISCESSR